MKIFSNFEANYSGLKGLVTSSVLVLSPTTYNGECRGTQDRSLIVPVYAGGLNFGRPRFFLAKQR